MKQILACLVALTATLCSCQGQTPATVKPGVWRAILKTPGGELPFGLAIEPAGKGYTVYALNGSERLKMDDATVQGDSLHIPMALFESELIGKIESNRLMGVWKRRRIGQQYQTMPFEAQYGLKYRFTPEGKQATMNVTGKWATTFRSPGSQDSSTAVGVFDQQGNHLTGTFLTPTGDYRFLEGNVFGDSLFLSCFDGSHVFLFKAKASPNHTMTGVFRAGLTGLENWVARFDPKAELPDAGSLTYLKPGVKTFDFSFPEPGGQVVSTNDARFKNKVTIVQILGSWCPNCMDETNFLSPWYKKNKSRGVEIVGLAFEKTADMAESGPKIQRMKERFKIDYPVALAGTNNKAEASKVLPALNQVVAFPTTIFMDKKGVVRYIHTGFSGPGTGKYYDQYVDEFNRLVDKLLVE